MLLNRDTLQGIVDGRIHLAFRRWTRPTVREGGTLLTAVGMLAIEELRAVALGDIPPEDAVAAGFRGLEALTRALAERPKGTIYRIRLRYAGPDPRIALRQAVPKAPAELTSVAARLAAWDGASRSGPWTRILLDLIAAWPGVRAADLAAEAGIETARLKTNVRKLKALGLTESLKVGYRLSPRGEAVLRFMNLNQAHAEPST